MKGTPLCANALPLPIPGLYASALQSLCLQLSTHTIRTCITWRSFTDVNHPYEDDIHRKMHIYPFWLLMKKCIDGYNLKGGRNIILSTLSNVSIYGGEHTIDAADVHYMCATSEDRYSRSITDQMSSNEILILAILGFPDMTSGYIVNVTFIECEDSKSMQLAVGRGGPTSNSRLIFTRMSWPILCSKWKTVFSPISFASHGAHRRWMKFLEERLKPKCGEGKDFPNVKPNLLPFAKTKDSDHINAHRQEYDRAYNWMTTYFKEAGLQVSDWACGQGIRTKQVEPLHCILRVVIIVLKYYFLHVIKYSEWLAGDSKEAKQFRERNHGEEYEPHDRKFILDHIMSKDCCNIPFSFNEKSPTLSSIKAEGAWRRTLWNRLEDVVCCDKCGFRPWKGSKSESYFLVLFVDLVELLTPLEILNHRLYAKYWRKYLKPRYIHRPRTTLSYENASVWMIYAQHFYLLFMSLLGNDRLTRYIHGVVFCTSHGFEIAMALKSSYRALFGSDVVERMNSLTKTILHTASSRLGGRWSRFPIEMVENTIGQIMNWTAWDRYRFRETSPRMNLAFRLKKFLLLNQQISDVRKLNAANRMRKRIMNPNRRYSENLSLCLPCPLSNEYHLKLDIFKSLDEEAANIRFPDDNELHEHDEALERVRATLTGHLFRIEADEADFAQRDPVNEESNNIEENWNMDEDDFEFDQSTLKRRFYRMVTFAFAEAPSNLSAAEDDEKTSSPSHRNLFSTHWTHDDSRYRLQWNPVTALTMKDSDFHFGADFIRLTTTVLLRVESVLNVNRAKQVQRPYRMTWLYTDVLRICHFTSSNCLAIWMKMACPPKIEEKRNAGWETLNELPTYLSSFASNGKIGIFLSPTFYNVLDISNLLNHWKHFTSLHHIELHEFHGWPLEFCDEEVTMAMGAYQLSKCPIMSLHSELCSKIDKLMDHYRNGGTRRCLSCQRDFGVFESHSICLPKGEEVDNISKHIFDRLILKGKDFKQRGTVKLVKDPSQSTHVTIAQKVIDEDEEFWGMFIMKTYLQFVQYLQRYRRRALMNCYSDNDYSSLKCHVRYLLPMLNRAMKHTLRELDRKPKKCDSRKKSINKMIMAVSNMFILPFRFQRKYHSVEYMKNKHWRTRQEIWRDDRFSVRFRHHFRLKDICSNRFFVDVLTAFDFEISSYQSASELWSF